MTVTFKRNRNIACYCTNNISTNAHEPASKLRPPFASCGSCQYAAHGFLCYKAEGDCLRSFVSKLKGSN